MALLFRIATHVGRHLRMKQFPGVALIQRPCCMLIVCLHPVVVQNTRSHQCRLAGKNQQPTAKISQPIQIMSEPKKNSGRYSMTEKGAAKIASSHTTSTMPEARVATAARMLLDQVPQSVGF